VSAEADELARAFEAANDEVIAFVESCPDRQWTSMVSGEDWSVAVVMHHIAVGHVQMLDWVGRASRGEAVDKSGAEIDADNARHAQDFAGVTRSETVEALRRHGDSLGGFIRRLTAEELATSVPFGPGGGVAVTTEQLASVAARHCRTHLDGARGTDESGIT
jgi:DinB family protein